MPRDALPADAFQFAASVARLEKAGADGRRKFSGVAYSGAAVPSYFGQLVIDIASSSIEGDSLGVLYQHEPDKIVGSGKLSFGKQMTIDGLLSNVTDEGKRVAALADEGFPWQLSIRVEPGEIDEIQAGKTVEVNGQKFTGPVTVFRNNLIREVSFTPVGRDSKTSAEVLSNSVKGVHLMPPADNQPTVESLQAQIAQLTATHATALAAEKARADAAEAEVKANRTEQVRALFAARGETFTDDAAKPFLEMSAAQFSAVVKIVPKTTKHDPNLFSLDGQGDGAQGTGKSSLVEKAQAQALAAGKKS